MSACGLNRHVHLLVFLLGDDMSTGGRQGGRTTSPCLQGIPRQRHGSMITDLPRRRHGPTKLHGPFERPSEAPGSMLLDEGCRHLPV
jgi:hypothetical protein